MRAALPAVLMVLVWSQGQACAQTDGSRPAAEASAQREDQGARDRQELDRAADESRRKAEQRRAERDRAMRKITGSICSGC